jgi:hypothetical protein
MAAALLGGTSKNGSTLARFMAFRAFHTLFSMACFEMPIHSYIRLAIYCESKYRSIVFIRASAYRRVPRSQWRNQMFMSSLRNKNIDYVF